MISDANTRISKIDAIPELDILLILLNTGSVLQQKLSNYPPLKNAPNEHLNNFKLIGSVVAIHRPIPDEDLSLKGFMSNTIRTQVAVNIEIALNFQSMYHSPFE